MSESDQEDDSLPASISSTSERLAKLQMTFTPSRPVQTRAIFAGRQAELLECLNVTSEVGLHAILHGERGVGKTSIVNIIQMILETAGASFDEDAQAPKVIKIECSSSDTFQTLVHSIYSNIAVEVAVAPKAGFVAEAEFRSATLAQQVGKSTSYNPKDVAFVLKQTHGSTLVILDEFDRLDHSKFELSHFTELLKNISDTGVSTHFLVVGVGDNVTSILGNHQSIVRNLSQIKMKLMDSDEIKEIVTKGIVELDLVMDPKIVDQIVGFSCGYPHYTHLLCLHACETALRRRSDIVEEPDLAYATAKSVQRAEHSLKDSYHRATMANQKNIYREVLEACSLAALDEYGTFQPKDVEKPLSGLLKKPTKTTQFGAHLIKLCQAPRGEILLSVGEKGRARYRFRDPLMRAYVKLKAAHPRV